MSEEQVQEKSLRIKVCIELSELSSKQRGAVLGLIKDMGFTRDEIAELTVAIPETDEPAAPGRRQKRK
ncbi:MAG: hypothetical protein ACYC99_11365 [Candidatus Geothermincolia bacterium]